MSRGCFICGIGYYDPQTGQFTQQDPIGLAGGLNLYGFANGDPVNLSDPFGLAAVDCPPNCRVKDFSELHHVIEQHVTNAYGTQFKDLDQNALKHMISSTVENGTLTDVQDHPSGRRFVFERDWGSEIGTKRERISRVVITESEELVTAFPVRNLKRPIGTALGSLARKYGSKVAKVGIIFGVFFDLTIGTSPLAAPTTSGQN